MTEKQYRLNKWGTRLLKNNRPLFDWMNDSDEVVDLLNQLNDENEQLKKEVEMLRNGLKAYNEALPLYLDCEDIMHFNNSELFEFKMEQMDFYKKYPNRVHYKCGDLE